MTLPKSTTGCPYLFLAPMEGLGDRPFRRAMASVGGFDEAVTEFIRVPRNAHIPSLAAVYEANELGTIPLAAQIMGVEPEPVAEMARELVRRGAKRIDLNCGCPSSTVVGKGAGSSLLKEPTYLHTLAKTLVESVNVPVTLKMRSGYEDTSLIKENLLAAQESGIKFLTLHPRTKVDGYGPPAKWEYISLAKSILKIPVVGNGDILTADDAHRMLRETGCDALMIGRGAATNPFIFHEIRASFAQNSHSSSYEDVKKFIEMFAENLSPDSPPKNRIGKLKQLLSFLFRKNEGLLQVRPLVLTFNVLDEKSFISHALNLWIKHSH